MSRWYLSCLLEVSEDGLHAGVQRRIGLLALVLGHCVLAVIPDMCLHLVAILLAIVYEGDLLRRRPGHLYFLQLISAVSALPDRH